MDVVVKRRPQLRAEDHASKPVPPGMERPREDALPVRRRAQRKGECLGLGSI